jgi:hypothetical protein
MYGTFECDPARFNSYEAWVLVGDEWREVNAAQLMFGARVMTKKQLDKTFGRLPPLPEHAFGGVDDLVVVEQ